MAGAGRGHGTNGSARNGSVPKGAGEAQLVVLPVLEKESGHPCFDCARCCHYVAIEIDTPTTPREYDYIEWYLYHQAVSVFVDWDNKWFVSFESRCEKLTPQGLCGIYERRPDICRDFDWRECEMHLTDDPPDKLLFRTAEEFLSWLRAKRPKAYERFQQWKRARSRGPADKALRRVRVTELLPEPGTARAARSAAEPTGDAPVRRS
jgi:Fe-S-cluster containining protein